MCSYSAKLWKNKIPKDSTQQDIFLSKYPSYDGKDIKIAIIDSGVDVSLDGLQKTSSGLPKVLDYFDFTGAGNVDTSTIKEMDSENILIGLSGRKLKIPTKWTNPSRKWHLGIKSFYVFPIISTTKLSFSKSLIEKSPEIDCIVWNDGKKWLACIETFGNLEDAKILTNFRDKHEYSFLSYELKRSCYCITVSNDGEILQICTPFSEHGSAVAQVAVAHFPQNPAKDGLAPGAQIFSMDALDPLKPNFMCTKAIKKAFLKYIEMKVDIINYSAESFDGDAELIELIDQTVKKHNF